VRLLLVFGRECVAAAGRSGHGDGDHQQENESSHLSPLSETIVRKLCAEGMAEGMPRRATQASRKLKM
jgi:hypothetical protein